MSKPLTDKQKERLKILEPKLDIAIQKKEYEIAKSLVIHQAHHPKILHIFAHTKARGAI